MIETRQRIEREQYLLSIGCFQAMARQHNTALGRGGAALASLAVHAVLIVVLIWGLKSSQEQPDALDTLNAVTTFELPPPAEPSPEPREREQGAPAPEGPEAEAVSVEAPIVAVPLAPPRAAPTAEDGQENRSGSGSAGSGTGAGGAGTGTGAGGTGDGTGGIATPARRIAGALRDSDYPRSAERQGLGGTVAIGFRVRTDGRVDRCSVLHSSGYAVLDNLTCRLFTERMRFEPARTATGRAVESTLRTSFTWGTRRR